MAAAVDMAKECLIQRIMVYISYSNVYFLQYFDAVDWVAGRASGL